MLISAILAVAQFLLENLFSIFDFPTLPEVVSSTLHNTMFTQAIANGASIFMAYTHYQFLLGLFVFCAAVETAEEIYKFVRFLLRKIPILNIS